MTNEPTCPGWYAFEGYVKPFAKQMEHEVVRVHWGKITQRWQVVWSRGHHPANMLVGKWTRLYMPWEQPAPDASVPDAVRDKIRLMITEIMDSVDGSADAETAAWEVDAWLDSLPVAPSVPDAVREAIYMLLELAKLRNSEIDRPECVEDINTIDAWLDTLA